MTNDSPVVPSPKSRGMATAEFSRALVQFKKDHMGRGPADVQTYFVNDMVLVRLRGILTPSEETLVRTSKGRALIKEMRRQIFEDSQEWLRQIVYDVLGCELVSMHTDMSPVNGEQVIVFVIDEDTDKLFPSLSR